MGIKEKNTKTDTRKNNVLAPTKFGLLNGLRKPILL